MGIKQQQSPWLAGESGFLTGGEAASVTGGNSEVKAKAPPKNNSGIFTEGMTTCHHQGPDSGTQVVLNVWF